MNAESQVTLAPESQPDTLPLAMRGSGALRILFLVDELESISAGGSERQVFQLIAFLRNAGHEVTLAVFRKSEWLKEHKKGYPIYFCNMTSVMSGDGFLALIKLVRWMRKQRFDVVQTMFREANLIGPPLARLAGVPLVLGSRRNLNYAMSRHFAVLQSIANLFATRLVANSEAVKNTVSRQERTSPTKIDVIYNGVDTQHFMLDPEVGGELRRKTRETLLIPDGAPVIGIVSRFGHIKGLDIFVQVAKAVLRTHAESYFVMVGGGPTLQEIQALVQRLNLANKCLFVSAQQDIRPFLAAFDIAVLSSRSEGFSNSLLEYMSAGLPIVATNVGGNAESLGDAGILVPAEDSEALADAISKLIQNPGERDRLGANARRRAQTLFDIDKAQLRIAEYFRVQASEHRN